jgi:glycosyltransferase involved in cell wall biosynthesis
MDSCPTSTYDIDVAIPTKESEPVIEQTLRELHKSVIESPDVSLNQLLIVDDESNDRTVEYIDTVCSELGWASELVVEESSLTEARERLISMVDTDWFLFLDDDVRLHSGYLDSHARCIAENIGAIQGRKSSRTEHPTDWVRRRARRGGTHATLLRTSAVDGIEYPDDMTLLEDEWTRRFIEDRGYLWLFNHAARFDHANLGRHPTGWEEGRIAGKYGLAPFHQYALNVPYSLVAKRSPVPHLLRTLGWLYGRVSSR